MEGEMKSRDLLLVLIDACQGRKAFGKTSLQKCAYFVSLRLGKDLAYRPLHYGPYSHLVESEVDALVMSSLVTESVENLGSVGTNGFPVKRFEYQVSDAAKSRIDKLLKAYPAEVAKIRELIDELDSRTQGLEQRLLSPAAKTLFITKETGKAVSTEEISEMAAELGWALDEKEVESVSSTLAELSFIKVMSDEI